MRSDDDLIHHYGGADLTETIDAALRQLGIDGAVTADHLAPVDEFHIGGRPATHHLLDRMPRPLGHVLDVGCGIGGTARLLASGQAERVTGIDLNPAYVATGDTLNERVGLADRIDLHAASATDLPFDDASFDAAVMLHVGMNVVDKRRLLTEVARVLRPGAVFGIYDIMRRADGEVAYPVPWAASAATSHLATAADYRRAAEQAGFEVTAEEDRSAFADEFFARIRSATPSPLGIHLLMGVETPTKVANMVAAVEAGTIAPTELVLTRPASA